MNRYVLCAALAGTVTALSMLFQRPISYNDGLGWDGAQYAQLAGQCGRERLSGLEPFTYRIGAPCLAALIPATPRQGLLAVNAAASVLLLFLTDAWLRRHLSSTVAAIVLAGFAFQWVAPLRQVWWYPTYIDPGALCAIVGALLTSHRLVPFALICFVGSLFRETTLIVPLSLAFGPWILDPRSAAGTSATKSGAEIRVALAGIAAGIAAIGLTHLVATPTSDYWMADAAFHWAYTKPLPVYLLALFIAFGPALSLIAAAWPAAKAHLAQNPPQTMMLALVLMLAWVGGSDTERFLMWGSPIVLVLIGKAAEQIEWSRARGAAVMLFMAQMVSGRWLQTIPPNFVESPARAWPFLTPWSAQSYQQLFSQTPDRLMSAVALAQYLALSLALAVWFQYRLTPNPRPPVAS